MADQEKTYRFTKAMRLRGRNAFKPVFDARVRKFSGPLTFHGMPNDLPQCRLGISVSKRIGNAAKRNRIKRLLREAFRLAQHDWPRGYDIVCVVKPHDVLVLAEYQKLLFKAVRGIHLHWDKQGEK